MVLKSIAFTTALAILGAQPAAPATDVAAAELIHEAHFSDQGIEVDLYVTRDAHGDVLAEATLVDPEREGTEVDVWTDGVTVWWDGTVDGERVLGSALAIDFNGPQEAAFCFTPVTAIACIGAVVLLAAGGCTLLSKFCPLPDPKPPGGAGGSPNEGGDGDGDGGTGTGTGGESGGDED